MRVLLAILWKDLLIEWRRRDRAVAMLLFCALVAMIFHFSLPGDANAIGNENAPGLLWIAYVFAAILGLNRAFSLELENDALAGIAMAPVDRGWIFLGKAAANFVILGVVQALTAVVFALLFRIDLWPVAGSFALVVALGSAGLCAVGTVFSAVAVRTRHPEVLLPLLLLPPLFPILWAGVHATAELVATGTVPAAPLRLLVVADGIYLIVSFVAFEYVLDE